MVDIGFGSFAAADKVLLILAPDSAPVRRMLSEAKEAGRLIDATYGRRTASVLVTESDHVILSALPPEDLKARFTAKET